MKVKDAAESEIVSSMIFGMQHESAAEHAPEPEGIPQTVVKPEASLPPAKSAPAPEPVPASTPAQQAADDIIARAMGTPKVVSKEEDLGAVLDDLGFE